jgi:hypothetical protein
MRSLMFFVLGVIFSVGVAATGRELILMEPITPSSTIILKENLSMCSGDDLTLHTKAEPWLKKGYIVKTVSVSGAGTCRVVGYMVLEKY